VAVIEVVGIERHTLAMTVEREPTYVGVHRHHTAALTIGDPALQVVALHDHVIPGGEPPAGQPQLAVTQRASGAQ